MAKDSSIHRCGQNVDNSIGRKDKIMIAHSHHIKHKAFMVYGA